jgi:mannose-6-phosphate isomerase-like protein (cupin superfamily)
VTDLSSPNLGGLESFAFEPYRVEKPWGWELVWAKTDTYCGKLLHIDKGGQLSLQFHREKDETMYVHEGRVEIEIGAVGDPIPDSEVVGPGAAFRIRPGMIHRLRALEDTLVLEVSTPELDDVVRLEDEYGRVDD